MTVMIIIVKWPDIAVRISGIDANSWMQVAPRKPDYVLRTNTKINVVYFEPETMAHHSWARFKTVTLYGGQYAEMCGWRFCAAVSPVSVNERKTRRMLIPTFWSDASGDILVNKIGCNNSDGTALRAQARVSQFDLESRGIFCQSPRRREPALRHFTRCKIRCTTFKIYLYVQYTYTHVHVYEDCPKSSRIYEI